MTITIDDRTELAAAVRALKPGYHTLNIKCNDNGCVIVAEYGE